jgi:hypothetical protein
VRERVSCMRDTGLTHTTSVRMAGAPRAMCVTKFLDMPWWLAVVPPTGQALLVKQCPRVLPSIFSAVLAV